MIYQNPQEEIKRNDFNRASTEENLQLAHETLDYAKRSHKSAEKARKIACRSMWVAIISALATLIASFK